MFFCLIITLVIAVITILLVLSTLEINIENLNICIPKIEERILNNNYKININLKVFGKIRIFKLDITKKKLENLRIKNRTKELTQKVINNKNEFDIEFRKILKKLKICINKLDLKLNIGTENAAFTSYCVGIFSTILAVILRKHIIDKDRQKFIVNPVYINKNVLNIRLNCIFEIEMIHIIYIIYILLKKRREEKYDRTSNRRSYGYSYE